MIRYALVLVFLFSAVETEAAQKKNQDNTQENTYDQTDVWYGPGMYNGMWFGSEDDFNDWHDNQDRNQDEDREMERGGGGRGGGGGHR